jgi:hypothetical protein
MIILPIATHPYGQRKGEKKRINKKERERLGLWLDFIWPLIPPNEEHENV